MMASNKIQRLTSFHEYCQLLTHPFPLALVLAYFSSQMPTENSTEGEKC
jgi:hypothetical protein